MIMTRCPVPGCKHEGNAAEYICQTHMRLVDANLRELIVEARYRAKRDGSLFRFRVLLKLLRRARLQAIERGLGI